MGNDLTKIVREAERQGWKVSFTGSGHLKFKCPGGGCVFSPSTPGRGRSLTNVISKLRRAGLNI